MFRFAITATAWFLWFVLAGSPALTKATTGGNLNITMLGFSSDSEHFLMIALGSDDGAGVARAKIMIVDLATNRCVPGGCQKAQGTWDATRTEPDVIDEVLKKTWQLRQKLQLTPPQGSYYAKGHFENNSTAIYNYYLHKKIRAQLLQKVEENQHKASMQLKVNIGNREKTLDSLDNYRNFALEYQLEDSLFISPDGKGFVFLIKVIYPDGGYDFIVQTMKV